MRAIDDSLRRLGVDHVDLYQVHRPDPLTPIDETVGALDDLVRAGKIRYWGTSTFPADEIVEARWAAQRRGVTGPHTEQPPYSILCRHIERDVLPACLRHGIGVIVWSPLSGGWLTGKYRGAGDAPAGLAGGDQPRPLRWRTTRRRRPPSIASRGSPPRPACPSPISPSPGRPNTPPCRRCCSGHEPRSSSPTCSAPPTSCSTATRSTPIDAIVAPGTDLNPADAGWTPPGLSPLGNDAETSAETGRSYAPPNDGDAAGGDT